MAPPPGPLIKFPLHPASNIGQPSFVGSFLASHPPPIGLADLHALRAILETAQSQARDRLIFKDANKDNVASRQANQKRQVEAQAELVNAERKRKLAREEEDRRERDKEREREKDRDKEEEHTRQIKKEDHQLAIQLDDQSLDSEDDHANLPLAQAAKTKHHPPTTSRDLKPTIQTTPSTGASPEPDDDGQPRPPPRQKPHEHRKRKRDQVVDSDDASDSADGDEPLIHKVRKAEDQPRPTSARPTPGPTRSASLAPALSAVIPTQAEDPDPLDGLTPIQRKFHQQRFAKHTVPYKAAAQGAAVNFQLPTTTLVPYKPPSVPPPSTAKRQSEVAEDFSKAKPGTQIAHGTFHTWADFYLRPFGEDDLAFLAPRPYDQTPYEIPALGKHYTERWDEEDADPASAAQANPTAHFNALEPPAQQRFRPDSISEDLLATEGIFLGPLSERLVAAMVFEEPGEGGELEEQMDDDDEGDGQGGGGLGKVLDAVELEERVKGEMRFVGLLREEEVSWAAREDDEVSSALRACQRALARQTALNEARKATLTSIVKDRMGFQEYEKTRDDQERAIETGWNRRQKGGKKKGKQSKADKNGDGGAGGAGGAGGPKAPVSEALRAAVRKRQKLVDKFAPFFEEEEERWRWFGMPEASVYGEEEE